MLIIDKYKSNIAVITDKGERLTYSELKAEANKFANAISQNGLMF